MHTISAMKVRQKLGEILAKIELRGEEIIMERGGKPSAVLISYKKIQMIRNGAAQEFKESLRKAAATNPNSDLSDEEVERFVDRVIHGTRSKK
ncbi:MAG: type II toxin-antitoxin system Phd/YefM family antitoxin [Deltaproteobacteria bacterium]|nr:type II toxin-antitoxin system Phd/YefM family antitoxin [Deltaproteobacteria bacterium]